MPITDLALPDFTSFFTDFRDRVDCSAPATGPGISESNPLTLFQLGHVAATLAFRRAGALERL